MAFERLPDVGFARLRVAQEQRLSGHDHPVGAIAALAGLLQDKGLLQHARVLGGAQTLNRGNAPFAGGADGVNARPFLRTVNEHTACATLRQPTAEFRAVQLEVVAQNVQQRGLGLDPDRVGFSVDQQLQKHSQRAYQANVCTASTLVPRQRPWSPVVWRYDKVRTHRVATHKCRVPGAETHPNAGQAADGTLAFS
jgi:hypothetical protein